MTSISQSRINQAIDGDHNAVLELLLDLNPDLSRFVRAKLAGTPSLNGLEDDVLQETYIQACNEIKSLRVTSPSGIMAWLRAIALNQIRDVARRNAAAKRGGDRIRIEIDNQQYTDRALGLVMELSDPGAGTPSQFVARNEAVDAIRIALSQLPADQRMAIRLHCFQGKSLDETAEQMDRTSGSVRGLIQRAKQTLRNAMLTSSMWLSRKG